MGESDFENSINDGVTMRTAGSVVLGRIDQYELVRELGGGGFGCVFLARDTVAGVDVAVKGLPPEVKCNKEELENIRENFALVSRLHHPNIAAALVLHPVKTAFYSSRDAMERLRVFEGDTLMVMEYAPGMTLSSWRKQFPDRCVPPGLAFSIVRQIAAALDYAHERKIVHRDIKPANVMVEQDADGVCTVKVLDFGLAAEIRSSMGRVSREIHDTSGTRPYMAPEQWAGERQGPETDQYSLAVLFHELLTGVVPHQSAFDSGDPVVMMASVIHQSIRMPETVPANMRPALLKALAKKPSNRFARCEDFVLSVGRRPFPWRSLVLGALTVGVAAFCWWWFVRVPSERRNRATEEARATEEKAALERRQKADAELKAAVERQQEKVEAERKKKAALERQRQAEAELEAALERQRKADAELKAAAERRQEADVGLKEKAEQQAEVERKEKAALERQRQAEAERKAQVAKEQAVAERKAARLALLRRLVKGSEFVPTPPERPAGTERSVSLPNGVKMDLVWCPPGRFLMGSPESEPDRNPCEKLHLVSLTKGFWIGKTEVTRAQWKSVMGDASFAWTSLWGGDGDFPIDNVNWHQCREFCEKLGRGVRLPTEAEWEYACRAGTSTPFDFGSALNGNRANCSGGAEPYGTSVSGPNSFGSKRVGTYARNPWGIYDMHGNLFEWCADRYGDYPTADVVDPQGDLSGATRVVRGGCWNFKPKMCRSAFRSRKDPMAADVHTGFRVCCDRLPD